MISIAGIADTHCKHAEVRPPKADILVVSGDFCGYGTLLEITAFNAWLGTLPHKHKIVVAGNHDMWLEGNATMGKQLFTNAIYLDCEAVEVMGIKFYGCPWTPAFCYWAFMYERAGAKAERIWAKVPDDTNVIISHGPPIGTGLGITVGYNGQPRTDEGCPILRNRIERLPALRATFHGHLHAGFGTAKIGNIVCHNVAVVDDQYDVVRHGLVYNYKKEDSKMRKGFTIIELMMVLFCIVIVLGIIFGMTMWTDRSMDYLLTMIKGHPVNCPYWLSFIITVVGNGATVVFNIIMEVVRLVK